MTTVKNLSVTSIRIYSCSLARLFTWLLKNRPQTITYEFKAVIQQCNGSELRSYVKNTIFSNSSDEEPTQNNNNLPVNFEKLTSKDFCDYIDTIKRPDGAYCAYSTYADHKSAFWHLYNVHSITISASMESEIYNFFSKFRKNCSSKVGNINSSSHKKKNGGNKISSCSGNKRKLSQEDDNNSRNSNKSAPSSPLPLLTKRIKPNNNEPNYHNNDPKHGILIATKAFLKKAQEYLGDEKYDTFGDYLLQFHNSVSLGKASKSNNAGESTAEDCSRATTSSEAITTLKSQTFSLFDGNYELYVSFERFLQKIDGMSALIVGKRGFALVEGYLMVDHVT